MAHEIMALNGTYNNGNDMAAMRVPSRRLDLLRVFGMKNLVVGTEFDLNLASLKLPQMIQ